MQLPDPVLLAIPWFFVGMAIEAGVGKRRGVRVFRAPDYIADLSLGVMQTVLGLLCAAVLAFGYRWLFEHARMFTIPIDSPLAWVGVVVGVDFCYYWFHRASHRIHLAWATHAPHHSSEDYNLAVALRQGPVQPFCSAFFYLPLAVLGFPIEMFAFTSGLNTVYQFWIHTELVGKLGPLEWFLNTPSHHRVHHGVNGKYIDKNHGGIFIVWDRLFGTFVEEEERPTYGTTTALRSWNPAWASVQPFLDVWSKAVQADSVVDKLRAPFMPPEWIPKGMAAPAPAVVDRARYDERPSRPMMRYAIAMFVVTLVVSVALLLGFTHLSTPQAWVAAAWVFVSMASVGALCDSKRWPIPVEAVRLLALPALVGWIAVDLAR